MKAKLTVRTVEALKPGASDIIIWDSEIAGFGCKVTPKGRRSYFLYYRTREAKPSASELMAQYEISLEGEQYVFRNYRYDKLEDAVAYAKKAVL